MKFLKDNAFLLFLSVSVIVAGGSLMVVSQKVYDRQKTVQALDESILTKQWDIRALKAELAYLSRPDRIEQISTAITQSEPFAEQQSGLAMVSYSIMNDLPAGMSLVPPAKPMTASYQMPKAVERIVQPIIKKEEQAEKEVVVADISEPKPQQEEASGFASMLDSLGGAQ